jgi:hypothetical protein
MCVTARLKFKQRLPTLLPNATKHFTGVRMSCGSGDDDDEFNELDANEENAGIVYSDMADDNDDKADGDARDDDDNEDDAHDDGNDDNDNGDDDNGDDDDIEHNVLRRFD